MRGIRLQASLGLVLPHAGAILTFARDTDGVPLRALDIVTGETRWTGQPVQPVNPDAAQNYLAISVGGQDYAGLRPGGLNRRGSVRIREARGTAPL
jgi:hypothetical protein